MMIRISFFYFLCLSSAWSFPCYFTLIKDSCWTDYQVSVNVIDSDQNKKITTLTVPAGTSWIREQGTCNPLENLVYFASFSPVFWKSDEGKTYRSIRNWTLPDKIKPGGKAWTVTLCFPSDFAAVPLPPKADSNCKCDYVAVTKIELDQ